MIDGIPKLIDLNITEWWMLVEQMEGDDCHYENGPMFAEMGEFTVTTPGGDKYKITEMYETITCVEKIINKRNKNENNKIMGMS